MPLGLYDLDLWPEESMIAVVAVLGWMLTHCSSWKCCMHTSGCRWNVDLLVHLVQLCSTFFPLLCVNVLILGIEGGNILCIWWFHKSYVIIWYVEPIIRRFYYGLTKYSSIHQTWSVKYVFLNVKLFVIRRQACCYVLGYFGFHS